MTYLDLSNSFFQANVIKDSIPKDLKEDYKLDLELLLEYVNYEMNDPIKEANGRGLKDSIRIISDIKKNEIIYKSDLDPLSWSLLGKFTKFGNEYVDTFKNKSNICFKYAIEKQHSNHFLIGYTVNPYMIRSYNLTWDCLDKMYLKELTNDSSQ